MHLSSLLLSAFMLFGGKSFAQNHIGSNGLESRYVIYPEFNFNPILITSFTDLNGETIDTEEESSYLIRIFAQRYRPNHPLTYALGLGYQGREFSVFGRNNYFFSTSSVLVSPRLLYSVAPSLHRTNTRRIEVGLDTEYLVKRSGYQYNDDEESIPLSAGSLNNLKSLKTYATVGFSFQEYLINHGKRQPLGRLSFEVGVPLFDQANLVRNGPFENQTELDEFQHSDTKSLRVGFTFTKTIGRHQNNSRSKIDDTLYPVKVGGRLLHGSMYKWFAPLNDLAAPKYQLYGRPYIKALVTAARDSIAVIIDGSIQPLNLSSAPSTEYGYSIHFALRDYSSFVSPDSYKGVWDARTKGARIIPKVFTSIFYRREYQPFALGYGRVIRPALGAAAGFSLTQFDSGIKLSAFFDYKVPLRTRTLFNGVENSNVSVPFNDWSINVALGYRHFLSVGARYVSRSYSLAVIEPNLIENMSLFITVGL